jgi:conjugal transfer ATP-binding protein TraC
MIKALLEEIGVKDRRIKRIESAITKEEVKNLYSSVKLEDFLKIEKYDKDEKWFLTKDNYVTRIFEVPVLTGVSENLVYDIEKSIFAAPYLPEKTIIQINLYADPKIRDKIEAYLSLKEESRIPIVKKYTDWLTMKTKEKIYEDWNALVRDFKIYITVKIPLKDSLDNKNYKNEIRTLFINLSSAISNIYQGNMAILNDIEYIYLTRSLLNPKYNEDDTLLFIDQETREIGIQPRENVEDLSTAIIDPETYFIESEDYIKINNYYATVYAVQPGLRGFPKELSPYFLYDYIGAYKREDYANIGTPFVFSFIAQKLEEKDILSVRKDAEIMLKQKNFSNLNPRMEERQEDYTMFIREIEKGRVAWKGSYYIYLFTDRGLEYLRSVGRTLESMMQKQRFVFKPEINITSALLACIPGNATQEHLSNKLERRTYLLDGNIALLTPLFADWKGTKTPTIPMLTRRGQIFMFDLFDSDGGYSAAIIAPTGRGKSFLSNHILFNYLTQPNTILRVVDVGDSYKGLNRLFNGTYIEMTPENRITLNPFYSIKNIEDELPELVNLTLAMVRFEEKVRDLERSFVEKAIKETYEESNGEPFGISEVVETMIRIAQEQNNYELLQFAQLGFTPYVEGGNLDYLFNGEPNVSLDNRFIVLELKSVLNNPALMRLVLLAFFQLINREVYYNQEKRAWKKVVLWDEWHRASANEFILDFSFRAIKEYRKFNASMILVTQNFGDFFESMIPEKTKNIYLNLEYIISLYQTPEEWKRLQGDNELTLSDFEIEVLETVNTVKGKYSEVFIVRRSGGRGIARLVLPPAFIWLYTTSAEEVAVREYFIKQRNGNIEQAIEDCILWAKNGKKKRATPDGKFEYYY